MLSHVGAIFKVCDLEQQKLKKKKSESIFYLFSKRQESLSPQKYTQHMMTSLDLLYDEVH